MQPSRQRQILLIASLTLTALLLGWVMGGVVVSRVTRQQLGDPAFLRSRLKEADPQDGQAKDTAPPLVRVDVAQEKMIQPQRPIIGRLVEVRKVTVSSEVGGKIIDIPVEEGTPVVGGQTVLARIDDIWCRLGLARCEAQVASIQAQLDFAVNDLQRCQRLREQNTTTESELQLKQSAVEDLQAKLAETKAVMDEQAERQTRSVLLAPFNGTVIAKHAELGGYVSVGSPIVDVVSRGEMDARLMMPESIINFIRIDQVLPILVDPLQEEVAGKVVSVTPYGPTASRTFPVRVRVDDQGGRLKVGMSVTAMIGTGAERKALVVSKDAVLVRPDGSTVWVAVAGKQSSAIEVRPVPVRICVQTAGEYAVEPEGGRDSGLLVPGVRVVIEGAERLTPGQQVRIVTLDGKTAELAQPGARPPQASPPAARSAAGGVSTGGEG